MQWLEHAGNRRSDARPQVSTAEFGECTSIPLGQCFKSSKLDVVPCHRGGQHFKQSLGSVTSHLQILGVCSVSCCHFNFVFYPPCLQDGCTIYLSVERIMLKFSYI